MPEEIKIPELETSIQRLLQMAELVGNEEYTSDILAVCFAAKKTLQEQDDE